MTLPSLSKTWQFKVNQALPALGTALADHRALLLAIRDGMHGVGSWTNSAGGATTPTNCFTTRYSCNSVTAGTAGDGVDRWASSTDLVWATAGSAHSWRVDRQVGIATNFEVLISCEAAAANGIFLMIVISPSAGFTGGTTTARPTATDEIVLLNGAGSASWTNMTVDLSCRLHVMSTTDGQCTRVIIYQGNNVVGYWAFEKPQNPVSGWTNPSGSVALGNAAPTLTNLYGAAAFSGRGVSTMTMFCTAESANSVAVPTDMASPNDLSSAYPFFGVGLYSKTAANRGKHGSLFDLWWGLAVANDGDGYPGSGTVKQFAQVADLIQPWNQSTMLTA